MQAHLLVASVLAGACTIVVVGCHGVERRNASGEVDTSAGSHPAGVADTAGVLPSGESVLEVRPFAVVSNKDTSNSNGTVRLLKKEGASGLMLQAQLAGLRPGEHAWHVHSGKCGQQAPPVLPLSAGASGQPLTAAADGNAHAQVALPDTLTIDKIRLQSLSVRVHRGSGSDPGPVIACADL